MAGEPSRCCNDGETNPNILKLAQPLPTSPRRDATRPASEWMGHMPVIRVFSPNGGQLAAGLMGAMAVGRPTPSPDTLRPKPEKARRKNPNRLTVYQHVYPQRSIARFAGQDGRVALHDLSRRQVRRAKPRDSIFCARRAWDQRAEAGYMKDIEDRFQVLAEALIGGQRTISSAEDREAVERFFALWYMRARHHQLEDQEIKLNGIKGDSLTKEQEENLEAKGYLFARPDGFVPARQLNGLWLQNQIDDYARHLSSVARWGVIQPQSGEFIITDTPSHMVIPITPGLALVGNAPDGVILADNLAQINQLTVAGSQRYFLARDLAHCPV